ncbi:ABC-three component system protein [Asticcacaulis sp. EMRT-3]|uniref:ABC-three component system protein n=1 Tax=Asticcacaulis sp. EMRT-3 TaxID=3040349 RepID=UPI0024AF909F|nr:ABC-three component system protein [Asticcacaulis sp. EMRT-3]MDI7774701.1 hypothetical protein [Asticcacaulis sp. EMRT-3]
MSNGSPKFSAAPSAAGYFYQARLALALCIPHVNKGTNIEVAIERLDDISFSANYTPLELLQVKHHIDRVGSLTDSSPDLWKTLRIWAEAITNNPSLPSRTRLVLVTTGVAPDESVASLLRPQAAYPAGVKRDPKSAADRLSKVAETSTNLALKPAFAAFLALTEPMRASLLSVVEVVDRQEVLANLDEVLEDLLRLSAPNGKAAEARERLEGWWWPRVCSSLASAQASPIAIAELEAKLDDIRDMLKRDALVADLEFAVPSDNDVEQYEGFHFVRQLKAIGIGGNRIGYAKRDYYRAFAQRSKWTREHVVLDGELENFEAVLIEEWEPRFSAMCDANAIAEATDPVLRQAGQQIYQWVEAEARFPLRSYTSRFLSVGSYHMLANDLRVGWHRDYSTLCLAEE